MMPTGHCPVWQWWQRPGDVPQSLVILEVSGRIAPERHESGGADHDRIGAQRQSLGGIDTGSYPAGDHERNLAGLPALVQGFASRADSRHCRDAGVIE